jgi:hypothetical protein
VHPLDALFLFPPDSRSILSFIPKECIRNSPLSWWAHLGSNQGPTGYEPVALPAELWAHSHYMLSPETEGVNPIPISDFGTRISESNSALPNLQSRFDIMFRGNFSTSLPGWDVVISLRPLLRSVGSFPGSHRNPAPLLPVYGHTFLQFQTASSKPSPLEG